MTSQAATALVPSPRPSGQLDLAPIMGAIRALAQEESPEAMLEAACRELTAVLKATACIVSRLDDGILRDAAAFRMPNPAGEFAYLLADYPVTQAVMERGEPRAVSLSERDVDSAEAFVLRDLMRC